MANPKRNIAGSIKLFLSTRLFLILLAVSLLAASTFLWQTQEARSLAQIASDTAAKARSYASETETRYGRINSALNRLADRGAPQDEARLEAWKQDAAFYIDTFFGTKSIAWVDDTFRIREIAPRPENSAYINQPANEVILDPLEVNLWVPVYDAVEFKGFILGIIDLQDLIAPIVSEIDGAYMLQLSDGSNPLYTSANWLNPRQTLMAARNLTLRNSAAFNLALAPTDELIAAARQEAQNTLFFALLLSFITVGAAAFAQNYLGQARASELRYRNLFKSSQDAIFVANMHGKLQDANLAATTLVGFSLAELQQMTVANLLAQGAELDSAQPAGNLPQAWLAGAAVETQFHHKDGHAIPVDLGTSPIGEGNEPEFLLAIARDITERKRAEDELSQYRYHLETIVAERTRALQEANSELESFSFSVSHDLRAPLRHIDGYVKLLEQHSSEQFDSTSHRYLKNVIEASQRMGQLIDDLLNFSRTSRSEMTFRAVDPNVVIEKVRCELEPALADRQISWEIARLPEVLADPALLQVVWTNLISNAVKFTGNRMTAKIEIGCIPAPQQDDRVIFYIRDNGVGFDLAYAHNLFGVFQRLHGEDEFEGTGIGLATVRRIIRRHDGEIWAEAAKGEGATFFFTMQLAE